jgi:hypothetical protein
MRAVVFKSSREVAVEDVPDARAEQDDDVVVRVTSSARLGIAGVFTATDAAPAPEGGHADGSLHVPWAALFNKGVTIGFGPRLSRQRARACQQPPDRRQLSDPKSAVAVSGSYTTAVTWCPMFTASAQAPGRALPVAPMIPILTCPPSVLGRESGVVS